MTTAASGTIPAAAPRPPDVPDLGYRPVPDVFNLPEGLNFGSCSGVAINSKGRIFVVKRGAHALMEFDRDGRYARSLGDGIFSWPHGLRIDAEDNIWANDGRLHIVVKFNPRGRFLMLRGVKG